MSAVGSRYVLKCSLSVWIIGLLSLSAGCAPVPTAAPPNPTPVIVPTDTAIPTVTEIPTPTATPFVPKATVKIVAHLPLTGPQSDVGIDLQRAAEMAVQERAGPLNELGYAVELISYDDRMDVKTAVANAKEIIAIPDILCGIGHYASSIMLQASEVYHSAGLAFVSPSNTSSTVTDRGYLEVNRVVGRLDVLGTAAAQFVKSQGASSVYIIQSAWDPGMKNAGYFKREADRIGIKVVGMVTTDASDDFSSIVARVMSLNPDLVYFAALAGQAGPFFRQARGAGYTGAFLTIDSSPALADLAGPMLTEGGGAYYVDTIAPIEAFPRTTGFVQDFDNRYGASPHLFAGQAYDAAGLCLKSIEDASRAKGGELPTREEVAKAIRAVLDYPGITGTYTFNKRGDPTSAEYFVYKIAAIDSSDWAANQLVATLEIAAPK